jgi:hypothetical protein
MVRALSLFQFSHTTMQSVHGDHHHGDRGFAEAKFSLVVVLSIASHRR